MKRGIAAGALVCSCVFAMAFAPLRVRDQGPRPRSRSHVVQMKAMKFVPGSVTVSVGDTIVWKNADALSHTAFSPSTSGGKPVFATREIKPGASVRWVVKGRGQLDYMCAFHPVMRGVVVVK